MTTKVTSFPVVLIGHAYWDGLVDWLRSTVLPGGKINDSDLHLFTVTDDPAEAVRIIVAADSLLAPEPIEPPVPGTDGVAADQGAQ